MHTKTCIPTSVHACTHAYISTSPHTCMHAYLFACLLSSFLSYLHTSTGTCILLVCSLVHHRTRYYRGSPKPETLNPETQTLELVFQLLAAQPPCHCPGQPPLVAGLAGASQCLRSLRSGRLLNFFQGAYGMLVFDAGALNPQP